MSRQFADTALSLAAGPPSLGAWTDIAEYLVASGGDDATVREVLPLLEGRLENWPPALRSAHIQVTTEAEYVTEAIGWDAATYGDAIAPWLRLVRTLVAMAEQVLSQPQHGIWVEFGFPFVERWEINRVRRLAAVPEAAARLPALRTLSLHRVVSSGRWPRGVKKEWPALFSAHPLLRIEHLDLSGVPLGSEGCQVLVASPLSRVLRELEVPDANLRDAGVAALARWPRPSLLRALDIRGAAAGPRALLELVHSPVLEGLAELALGGNDVNLAVVEALSSSERAQSLRLLDCSGANLSDGAVAVLAMSRNLVRLEVLRLGNNLLTDDVVDVLLNADFAEHLVELDMSENKLTSEAAARFEKQQPPPCLRRLQIFGNRMSKSALETVERWGASVPGFTLLSRRPP